MICAQIQLNSFFLLLFIGAKFSIECFSIQPNTIKVNKYRKCPGYENNAIKWDGVIESTARNKVTINANLSITERITSPVKAVVYGQRCDFNLTHCEDFGQRSFPNICPLYNQNYVWADIAKGTTPQSDCPMKKGIYTTTNAILDLSFVSRLPMAGYTWIITAQLLNDIPKKRHKKVVYCILLEVLITEYHDRKRTKDRIP